MCQCRHTVAGVSCSRRCGTPDNTSTAVAPPRRARGLANRSQYLEPEYAPRLIGPGAGGVGYLLKESVAVADELVDAARRVAGGGRPGRSNLEQTQWSKEPDAT
ncbi:hypothetical protein [Marmoricola sp. URHB0036]|uniref:hypothetical protein n=1 Tax=Marmoricola sp. URHB0036 TaxID=1298863 RepID=UPI000411BE40|nr:hypothetical protein [Marmoricola sp. URHB0036]